MAVSCEELFEGFDCSIIGNGNEAVSGLAYSSSSVKPGDAFFCIVGTNVDGHTFAQDAIDKGASVLVTERPLYLADATDVTTVVTSDSRAAMAHAAATFYGNPSHAMELVGITGTNGKTTVTYLVEHIAAKAGYTTGIIGTVGMTIAGAFEKTERTTPESVDLECDLARMRSAGCQVVAMEVSSHALDLMRTLGLRFAVTAFTNLTHDHLDYHHTFDAYFKAKSLLFSDIYPAKRVIDIDGEWGRKLATRCIDAGDDVITCGFSEQAAIHVQDVEYSLGNTRCTLSVMGQPITFTYPLIGRFNVENVMVALGIAISLGIDAATAVAALSERIRIPGRLEAVRVEGVDDIDVFVDYAHTPDALVKALGTVKELTRGNTIVVFGCEGDRDTAKRPIMGKASLEADFSIVSSDNIRTEDRLHIIDDVLAGMADGRRLEPDLGICASAVLDSGSDPRRPYTVLPERRDAIKFAISLARPGDSVLIAGKGHEDYEVIGTVKYHLDDVEEATAALKAIAGERGM